MGKRVPEVLGGEDIRAFTSDNHDSIEVEVDRRTRREQRMSSE
jgi:hypothetical protein